LEFSGILRNSLEPIGTKSLVLSKMRILCSYLVFCLLFEWSNPQSLFRINTAQDTSAFMHSFKPPFSEKLYFWEAGAGTKITREYIELTPAKQASTGFFWNVKKTNMKDWEAVFDFKLQGRVDLGGDGFAFWFVENKGLIGPVYGSTDYWTGLGVFFDTFDNDRTGQTPLISLSVNDGTVSYVSSSDGADNALGTCSFNIRNTAQNVYAKVRYVNTVLNLQIALESDILGLPIYLDCAEAKNVRLSPEGYFGLSAHTGDLADSHHIFSLTVKDLSPMHANLNDLKKQWEQEQETLHKQHNTMTEDEFKHQVLTQLRQTQEEVNMIEISTLADQSEIKKGLDMIKLLEVLLTNLFSQFRDKIGDGALPTIGEITQDSSHESLVGDLNQIKSLVQALKTTPSETADQNSRHIAELTSQVSGITRDLLTLKRDMENTQSQTTQIIKKLASQNEFLLKPSESSGGSGWTYFIIAVITAPLGGVLSHFCKPKKHKYSQWN